MVKSKVVCDRLNECQQLPGRAETAGAVAAVILGMELWDNWESHMIRLLWSSREDRHRFWEARTAQSQQEV